MVRHLRTKLSDRDLQGSFFTKLRASEDLKADFIYYVCCPDGHADKSYRWLSALMDQLIASEQQDKHISALTSAHLSKGTRAAVPTQPGHPIADKTPRKSPGDPKPSKGPKKEDREAKDKGKGTGRKEKDGKRTSGSESGSESESAPGKRRKDIPEKDRCCIHASWGLCSREPEKRKFGKHVHLAPPGIREHALYIKYAEAYGSPPSPGNAKEGWARLSLVNAAS